MEYIKIIEKLIKKCENCKLNECVNCEISWEEMGAIKELIKSEKFYKEWYEFYKKEQSNINKRAWTLLAKVKNVEVSDLINLDIEKVLNELEQEIARKEGQWKLK